MEKLKRVASPMKIIVICCVVFALGGCERAEQDTVFKFYTKEEGYTSKKQEPVEGMNGMVVSAHPIASKVGRDVLAAGGNATDAMVAVNFALAVVYPIAGNIGGGGFMVRRSKEGDFITLDFRESAPGKAHSRMYLDKNGEVIEGKSVHGHLSVGVPGAVRGMAKAHIQFGSLKWQDLLAPAIELAEKGFALSEIQANHFNSYLKEKLRHSRIIPTCYDTNIVYSPGDTIRNMELAKTLKLLALNYGEDFYLGATAQLILKEMELGNGIIEREDLERYSARWREPVLIEDGEHKIYSMGPPSSGGVLMGQILKSYRMFSKEQDLWNSLGYIHKLSELEKLSYADRASHLGDPSYMTINYRKLLESNYLLKRLQKVSLDKATPSQSIKAGDLKESEETTHFSIVDKWGEAISVTTTLNGAYGSGVVVEGGGFFLNNEMDDFAVAPGVANSYGLVADKEMINGIDAYKRMLSSMTPTIVEKNDSLFAVIGSPGGSTIITSVLQTYLNLVDYDMNIQEAVSALKFHHQWSPDKIFYEKYAIDSITLAELGEMGHNPFLRSPIGKVDAIQVRYENGKRKLFGGADPRGDDAAVAY